MRSKKGLDDGTESYWSSEQGKARFGRGARQPTDGSNEMSLDIEQMWTSQTGAPPDRNQTLRGKPKANPLWKNKSSDGSESVTSVSEASDHPAENAEGQSGPGASPDALV